MKNISNHVYCIQAITNDDNSLLLTSNDFEIDFVETNSIQFIHDIETFNTFDEAKFYIAENQLANWCKNRYNGETASNESEAIITLNILPIMIGIKYSESIKITDI